MLLCQPEEEVILQPHSIVTEVPSWIFDDREPQIEIREDMVELTTEENTIEIQTTEQPQTMDYAGEYELTAYIETGNPCADGVYPQVGYTAACNNPELWHKWVHIEGHGDYYIHDTGGMADNVIDIYMGSYDEAIQFGRRVADVYIKEE
jgi:3D (Asp-Asp-Asp) domain-containing protein